MTVRTRIGEGALVALTLSTSALAQEEAPPAARPCPVQVPHLEVQIVGADDELARDTWVDLASGMRERHVLLCDEPGFREGRVGAIQITVVDGEARVRVIDDLTDKELVRRVELDSVPADGRSLLLAVTAEELVRASWAELAFRPGDEAFAELARSVRRELQPAAKEEPPPPPAPPPPPPAPSAAPEASDAGVGDAPPEWRLGLLGAVDGFTAGPTLLGADLSLRRQIVDRVALSFDGFARGGIAQDTQLGAVDAVVVGGGLALVTTVWRAEPFALRLDGGVRFGWARFTGEAEAPVTALTHDGVAVLLRGGASMRWAFVDALRLVLRMNGGGPARSVVATADDEDLTGLRGVELGGALGLETAF